MTEYSPHHLSIAKTWLVYLYLLLEHGIHHILPTIVLGMTYCHTSCSVQGWTAELTMYLPLTAMEDQQIMSNSQREREDLGFGTFMLSILLCWRSKDGDFL
jgi:hypothetical protein